jgi:hypothetical protein
MCVIVGIMAQRRLEFRCATRRFQWGANEGNLVGGDNNHAVLNGLGAGFCDDEVCYSRIMKLLPEGEKREYSRRFIQLVNNAAGVIHDGTDQEWTQARNAVNTHRRHFLKRQWQVYQNVQENELNRHKNILKEEDYIEWFMDKYMLEHSMTFLPESYIIPDGNLPNTLGALLEVADPRSAGRLMELKTSIGACPQMLVMASGAVLTHALLV